MALEHVLQQPGAYRVVLEWYPEGVYLLVFATAADVWPCQDHLQDNWELAKLQGLRVFGIGPDEWTETPDTHAMDDP